MTREWTPEARKALYGEEKPLSLLAKGLNDEEDSDNV